MSYTIVHRTPLDVAAAHAQGLARLPFKKGLFKTTSSTGVLESAVLDSPFPFDDLIGSWDAELPKGAGLELQARVRAESGWSDWFVLARADGAEFQSADRQENEFGYLDVDTLKLKKNATALQYRFRMTAGRKPAVLRLAAVTVSSEPAGPPTPFVPGPWVTELKVKPRSQLEEQDKYKHDICSPTSLAMALDYWKVSLPTVAVAELVRDRRSQIFGHWPFNTAVAGSHGLEAYVARLGSLEDLQREIAAGRPVVTSLTFGPNELEGSPLKSTKGHLVLVVGFTAAGDVIAMDPAAPDSSSVRRVYKRLEFDRAWRVNKRGLAYLIGPLKGRKLTVGMPVAELMAVPRVKSRVDLDDADHLSQLLYGETVTLQEAKDGWVRVLADEQPDFNEGRRWQGYPGWVRADALNFSTPPEPNVVVRTRQALLQKGPDMLLLSVGTRLSRVSESKGASYVRLVDGSLAEIASDSLYAPPALVSDDSRSQIIKTAELFLGTSYYWGGRCGVQPDLSIGVDCSGLVSLAYRIHGLILPRDSHEQKLESRPLKSREMKPADLVFLTDSDKTKEITHVMIYTGGDGVIESRKSSGRVLRSSFKERFGKTLSEIESGDTVTDYSFPKPRPRKIYFGTYF